MSTILTPAEWRVLLACPGRYTRGAPAKEITKTLHGRADDPAVDRTIAVLRSLSDKGLVHAPHSIHTFARYFARGYRLTDRGEEMVERYLMEGAA